MKSLRILLVIILSILTGRVFNANAQTVTILHMFTGLTGFTDGWNPDAGLVQGSDGNFYGTTAGGGTNQEGTVFRISPGGSETILYMFGSSHPDGVGPFGGLVQGSDGDFYGTTAVGGIGDNGIIFRISPSGSYTILHLFGSVPSDGINPQDGLVQGSDGNFYGTTLVGGTADCGNGVGCGTVFRISPGGSYTSLYSFGSQPGDGNRPYAELVQGSDGNFYGTTWGGGTNANCVGSPSGCGTVFRISPGGSCTSLYSFGSFNTDGANPRAGLVQGSDGNFYGTTEWGGANDRINGGRGSVFRISSSGCYTSLYSFGSIANDGANPLAGLVQGSDGNFYGTTAGGGASTNCLDGCGTIFRISPGGSYTSLYSFVGTPNDGFNPGYAGLVQGSDGNFYGMTEFGGSGSFPGMVDLGMLGTVFKVTVPLCPPPYPINQITGIQLSGTDIVLAIPSIATETYQLQFSSSMNPTNWVNVPGVSVTNSIGALLTLTNFGGAVGPQGFYRFDITP